MASHKGKRITFGTITHEDPQAVFKSIRSAVKSAPVMTAMRGRGFGGKLGHWIVVIGHEAGELLYLDPWCLRKEVWHISGEEFSQHWASYAVFLKHSCFCAR